MNKQFTLIIVAVFAVALMITCKTTKKVETKAPAIDAKNMDLTVNPGDDFFKFANGGWMKNNPIPEEKSRFGAFDEIADNNQKQIKGLVDDAVKNTNAPKGSNIQKISDFYNSGMDTIAIEKAGISPLKDELDLINKVSNISEFQKELAHLQTIGIGIFFRLSGGQDAKNSTQVIAEISQGGLGLPERGYYMNQDNRSKEIRTEYQKYISKIFSLAGDNEQVATANAKTVFDIEMQFATISNSRVENRDPLKLYNKKSIEELNQFMPNFNWIDYVNYLGYPNIKEINVAQLKFFAGANNMINSIPIDSWKIFMKWKILTHFAGSLTKDFVDADFAFFGKFMNGQPQNRPRWKRILDATSGTLGEVIGQLYVEKYFPAENKKRMLELVGNLRTSLKQRIEKLTWMGPETKKEALAKLDKINVKVGYPDKWRDYSSLEITKESFVANLIRSAKFRTAYNLNKIGKPVDRVEWGMTPQTVNAYYSPNMNEIVFPAGILQPPFFNMSADDAVNYGGIGVVIGHEMSHGFDDQGRQFDKDGNMRVWWTSNDSAEFVKRVKLIENQYNGFVVKDTAHVNGKLTLGENIADFGGLTISYNAFLMTEQGKDLSKKIDGFTAKQRFFMGYAQVWRANIREKALLRQLQEDVHSPAQYRVNGALFDIPEFYEAFPQIKPTDKLFRTQDKLPVIW